MYMVTVYVCRQVSLAGITCYVTTHCCPRRTLREIPILCPNGHLSWMVRLSLSSSEPVANHGASTLADSDISTPHRLE
ncbi:hypothetical protein COCC4DRAFT_32796 [Bipolaris maydis ATCC 48331]|uniref:Uncharacterized protein n=2 Tax=Cochliobolus heterostrophus TaxID=5016 RepID=M2SNM6_COCH5|nr:uncharacterized protein COCC4DRAFT_32796 [Bipolaris maydis ATCC 48331]EMD86910.1 hypothetical protein COCHEDRAFT_1197804 [Bipolaris maydis C5]ENI04092.1 hypothetical protein COCC4DRAFT_32796 [Bipolaris maydis ATCC 48331]